MAFFIFFHNTIYNRNHIHTPTHTWDVVLKVYTSSPFVWSKSLTKRINLFHPRLRCFVINIVLRCKC